MALATSCSYLNNVRRLRVPALSALPELAPQPARVRVQRACRAGRTVVPDSAQQVMLGACTRGVVDKAGEQRELARAYFETGREADKRPPTDRARDGAPRRGRARVPHRFARNTVEANLRAQLRQDAIERDVLHMLTGQGGAQPLWSVPDLGRAMESDDDAEVAVDALHRAGLIHKTADGFVFATCAGMRAVQMVGYII
jgi:hypothetical protein